jgi:hypothetical protein
MFYLKLTFVFGFQIKLNVFHILSQRKRINDSITTIVLVVAIKL